MTMSRILSAAVACVVFAGPASAYVIDGTTTGAPTWQRPVDFGPYVPTALSDIGTAVPFTSTAFSVTADGSYLFVSRGTNPADWDNYAFLYQDVFNPAAPLTNVLIGNDDYALVGFAGFDYTLQAGKTYYFVTTGYDNLDFGAYRNEITGPGNVVLAAVPEPASAMLLAFGLAGLIAAGSPRARTRVQA